MEYSQTQQTLTATFPAQLLKQAEAFVAEGGSDSLQSLLIEALRRYLDTHQISLTEMFIREDAEWGLHGEG